jgi:OmpA-OmpF porin, OOP family
MNLYRSSTIALLGLLLAGGAARAQKANVDAQLFRPPAVSGGILGLDTDRAAPHLALSASAFIDYAHDPLVLTDKDGKLLRAVVSDQFELDLAIAVSLFQRVEVGVLVPVLVSQSVDDMAWPAPNGLARSGIGDVRLEVKARIAQLPVGGGELGFAAAADLTLPTGPLDGFYGEGDVTFRPRLIGGLRFARAELSLQVGAVLRGDRTLHNLRADPSADLHVGQQLAWGLGGRLKVWGRLSLSATVGGLVGLTGTGGAAGAPTELLVGPEYRMEGLPLTLVLAGGRGLTDGYGAPDARLLAALRWQPTAPADRDGDTILDGDDKCPDQAGTAENHGCPDADGDGDGLLDRLDKCPAAAGPRANGGCPDGDQDADGIVDRLDRCPREAGPKENGGCPDRDRDGDAVVDRLDRCADRAGPAENEGCPWPDRDGDTILDGDDKCPDQPGIAENQGCPDLDSDGDGFVDRLDKCPKEKEIYNGFEDEDGCPDKGPELAVLTEKAIEIRQQVQFATGQATISKRSFLLLATVAKLLTLHPEIALLRVEGHTDNTGRREKNLQLSQARAEAVVAHLVTVNGIAKGRLTAQGFGPDRPIGDNKRSAGRQQNRRSEFNIVEKR